MKKYLVAIVIVLILLLPAVGASNLLVSDKTEIKTPLNILEDDFTHSIIGKQDDEQPYRNAIQQCGNRDVPDIDVDVNVQWKGNAILKISVTVQNNEPEDYNGYLRVYIVEIESRWNDASGNPYHFGVLYIPIEKSLAMPRAQVKPLGDSYTFTRTWIGALYGFGDVTQDNVMVIASVFDPDSDYAVETAADTPTSSGYNNIFYFPFLENLKIWHWINARAIRSNLLSLT